MVRLILVLSICILGLTEMAFAGETGEVVLSDVGPIVSLVSHGLTCGTFLIVLVLLRSYISYGVSVAIAEVFLKTKDLESLESICHWFGNGEEILEHLKRKEKES